VQVRDPLLLLLLILLLVLLRLMLLLLLLQGSTELKMRMLGDHGQFSPSLYKRIMATCTFSTNKTVAPAAECAQLLLQMK